MRNHVEMKTFLLLFRAGRSCVSERVAVVGRFTIK